MLKSVSLLCGALLLGSTVFADDGGVVGISVKDLNMYKTGWTEKGGSTQEKVDQPSYKIELNGGEAGKLMRILPSTLYVITSMYPKFAPTYNANFKTLAITGSKTQPTVNIDCQGGEIKEHINSPPTFTKYKDGAHCTIQVQPVYSEDDNIDYTFNPTKALCHK